MSDLGSTPADTDLGMSIGGDSSWRIVERAEFSGWVIRIYIPRPLLFEGLPTHPFSPRLIPKTIVADSERNGMNNI